MNYEHWATPTLRSELKYLRRKRRFIKRGQYLPMTMFNYKKASSLSYRPITYLSANQKRMQLACGDWVEVSKPITDLTALQFCGACADARYREIMLGEIDGDIRHIRLVLGMRAPWYLRWWRIFRFARRAC